MGQQREGKHHERGAAAVELALVLPLLILLIGGIIDFGFAFNTQISLTHAAREGVRVEAIGTGDAVATATTAFSAPAATGVTASVDRSCPDAAGARMVVSASSPVFFLQIIPGFPGQFALQGQAVMRCGG